MIAIFLQDPCFWLLPSIESCSIRFTLSGRTVFGLLDDYGCHSGILNVSIAGFNHSLQTNSSPQFWRAQDKCCVISRTQTESSVLAASILCSGHYWMLFSVVCQVVLLLPSVSALICSSLLLALLICRKQLQSSQLLSCHLQPGLIHFTSGNYGHCFPSCTAISCVLSSVHRGAAKRVCHRNGCWRATATLAVGPSSMPSQEVCKWSVDFAESHFWTVLC